MSVRWEFRVPEVLAERVDAACGLLGQPRSEFVRRALEERLGGLGSDQPRSGISAEVPATAAPLARPPASPRASEAPSAAEVVEALERPSQKEFERRAAVPRAAGFNIGPKPFAKPIPKGK